MESQQSPIRYILYARKSQESADRQVQSLESQLHFMRELAAARGLKVVAELTEARSARAPNNRPVFSRAIQMIHDGHADGLLCWKVDRLSRNPEDSGLIMGCLQRGALKSIVTHEKEYRSDDNTLTISVELAMANQYVRDLVTNVNLGFYQKLRNGGWPCAAPAGYMNDRNTRTTVRDPARFPLIERAWRLALLGNYSVPEILDKLNHEWKYRTRPRLNRGGKPLARSALYTILSNPFYAGIVRIGKEEHAGTHEAMVTLQEFDRVQKHIHRPDMPRPSKPKLAYARCFRCECGCMIVGEQHYKQIKDTTEVRRYVYYHCSQAKRLSRCAVRQAISESDLTTSLTKQLHQLSISAALRDWALRELARREHQAEERERQGVAIAVREEKSCRDVLERAIQLCIRGVISAEELDQQRSALQARIARLRLVVSGTGDSYRRRLQRIGDGFRFLADLPEEFQSGTPARRRDALVRLCSNQRFVDGKPILTVRDEWMPVVRFNRRAKSTRRMLEPVKSPSRAAQSSSLARLSPLWWRVVDEVIELFSAADKKDEQLAMAA